MSQESLQRRSAARFSTTQWSLILAAADRASPRWRASMEDLCRRYWPPIYAFLRRRGRSPADAEDLTQTFLALLIEKEFLRPTGPEKGRFRSFLLMCLKRFLANEQDYRSAQKRGGGAKVLSIDASGINAGLSNEPADPQTADAAFERQWAMALLEGVLGRLADEYTAAGKEQLFHQLKSFLVRDDSELSYRQIADRLGVSEAAIKVAVHRLRRRYGETLRREVARTVQSEAEVEDEMCQLFSAVRAGL